MKHCLADKCRDDACDQKGLSKRTKQRISKIATYNFKSNTKKAANSTTTVSRRATINLAKQELSGKKENEGQLH
ncbi:hypothetical protein CEXT_561201 [Caerostris extrusa]|uniref:Uncharacterized protein n=1 Tax=Caerostris extrusa TaxID=172846 RepID=A0AAV4M4H0_CAEEX|nr:hypothetical protein CEXT_561201 [Caerostris extrusa]